MGEISVDRQHLGRLLADSASTYGAPYQRAFAQLAEAQRGRPAPRSSRCSAAPPPRRCSISRTRTSGNRRRRSARASRTSCA
ncbi:hypothetical protein [Streptomyces sp. NPDC050848]|uniref:hypothetical protein n=1 Tax=Streptomyces sp. NPDC050848 TaxID=3155791 RepID=UPI0033DA696F